MIYDITARITTSYIPAAGAGRHVVRLEPLSIPGTQRLIAGEVRADPPPDERLDRTDFFGNAVTECAYLAGLDALTFSLRATVERLAQPVTLDLSPPLPRLAAELDERPSLAADAPHHFLAASDRVAPLPAITRYAREVTAGASTTLETVRALGAALHRDMSFDPSATTVETLPIEAFEARHGVCQDFAHVMIAALRGLGVPAAYVSGFLRTLPPPGQERLEGADAMHAWIRAWTGIETGWIEFDPTNDCLAGTDHIVVGYGRDYGDVAPVRGILRLSGRQKGTQAVDVVPRP
ncbi:Transglutaminase-like enzyme, putative cysteine protease [Tranquillimonas rosea]|uniref:Transglutaminase-like enzyme, putative cysteine protease n=1 Tax=Tranquillimonas rosea TaxID=641238 RepID=A0A1H9WBN9_9RHOB|nr:transglutaminase family protein [Tranquillimonas rosea]SES31209.1 Transglutaminase-like enzyme, putative cysteine protease [Tranquillimonas rosea]